jgi:hypothetical protein
MLSVVVCSIVTTFNPVLQFTILLLETRMSNIRELTVIPNGKAGRIGSVPILRKSKISSVDVKDGFVKEIENDLSEDAVPVHARVKMKTDSDLSLSSTEIGVGIPQEEKWLPQWKLHQVLCQVVSGVESERHPLEHSIRQEIKGKLSSHKSYDQAHNMAEPLATDTDILYKMLLQKERCFYCHRLFHVLYQDRFDPFQWSIDRIDNSKGHTSANTVITCLRCNLRRRTRETGEFYRDRNLNVIKSLE